jgi:serine protease AprX
MKGMQRSSWYVTVAVYALFLPVFSPAQQALSDDANAALNVQANPSGCTLSLPGQPAFYTTTNTVQNARLVPVAGTPVQLAVWDEQDRAAAIHHFYAISLDGTHMATVRQTSYSLKLRVGEFDPAQGVPAPRGGLAAEASCDLYLVQFITQPLQEFRDQITALGGTVRQFIENHAHIVQMSPAVRDAVAALPYVRYVGPYHPAYRLETCLFGLPRSGKGVQAARYNILVFEGGVTQKQDVAARVRAIGGYVDSDDFGKRLLVATLTPDQLYQVAGWNEVLFVDRWSPMERDMNNGRVLGGANYLEGATGFTGQGVRGEVFDAGFNLAHVDFQSRPLIQHGVVGADSHGASTSGIVFGDGTGNAMARGLLPSGQGIVGDYNTIGLEGPSRYTHTGEEVQAPYFCVFETASVGSAQVSNYTNISADTDDALFDFDIVHCQSQSNTGSTASRPQAWAKNIISGGGTYHYDNQNWLDDCWCGGASIGPAEDGRIKPDLCAFYDAIFTTTGPGTNAYTSDFGGTSGATPTIAGHVGLFFEMWANGLFGNEVDPEGTVFDNRCHMTTAKAVMINNAHQYSFSGTTGDLTRVHQGWGWPNVQNIYDRREKMFIIDETQLLTNLQSVDYSLNVEAGEPEFKATMTYADPAGVPGAAHARINDLTLKVTDPNGTIYWGNNGLLSGNYSTPGGSANHVDTVENVFVQDPPSGLWIVTVMAEEINQDSHVETPDLDADFALVVSGVTPCSSAGTIRLDRTYYPCESDAVIRVLDCDLNLDSSVIETVTVTIASTSEPAGESVLLTETGPATASFSGSIPISSTAGEGALLVVDGDTITATYIDASDGLGHYDVVVTDTALVDCVGPAITNVHATDVMPRSAKVTFTANEPVRATVHYGLSCGALVYTAGSLTYDVAPVVSLNNLTDNTTYYYAAEAEDQAGNVTTDDNGGACYSFTTPEVPDFFTQLFTGDNDLDNFSLIFTPNNSNDFYLGCSELITELPTDPTGGTTLSLSDDSYASISLSGGATVSLYGVSYSSFYVGSNGYITFNSPDTEYNESLSAHFDLPRVSALFDDLNPAQGGTVSWKQLSDRAAITWWNVPEYNAGNQNTFQIELYFDGQIKINYLAIAASDGLAGLSAGNGVDPDFFMSDLSGMGPCQTFPPSASDSTVSTDENVPVSITLLATDDGMPNPPGALAYIVTALPAHGSLADPAGGAITGVPYTLLSGGKIVQYTPITHFVGSDSFQFIANDGGAPPDGGDSNTATVTVDVIGVPELVYSFPLDSDPGWTTTGAWAFGHPLGAGSHLKDPADGYTGTSVYGYNLAGDYANNLTPKYLTTTAIDCSNYTAVELRFWRWLGIEVSDHAGVEMSTDGATWTPVWSNITTISEGAWTQQVYSLGAAADNQPTVYIRWVMGPTDVSVTYPGWNIDDIEFWAMVPAPTTPGDLNCDDAVDFGDINPFILALSDPTQYLITYANCDLMNGDINLDGSVDFSDINPFVHLLTGK